MPNRVKPDTQTWRHFLFSLDRKAHYEEIDVARIEPRPQTRQHASREDNAAQETKMHIGHVKPRTNGCDWLGVLYRSELELVSSQQPAVRAA